MERMKESKSEILCTITCILRYEGCWPVIVKGAQGAVVVLNADDMAEDNDVEYW